MLIHYELSLNWRHFHFWSLHFGKILLVNFRVFVCYILCRNDYPRAIYVCRINKRDAPSYDWSFLTCTKSKIFLFSFQCRVIRQCNNGLCCLPRPIHRPFTLSWVSRDRKKNIKMISAERSSNTGKNKVTKRGNILNNGKKKLWRFKRRCYSADYIAVNT